MTAGLVAGHLQKKSGYWYCVITYREDGKPKAKWYSTGLKVTGNKKRAEEILIQKRMEFSCKDLSYSSIDKSEELRFSNFILQWLEHKQHQVEETTYTGYYNAVHRRLLPYVEKNNKVLKEIDTQYLQAYIDYLYHEGMSHKTVKNHRGILSNIFNFAIKMDLTNDNPVNRIDISVKTPAKENYFDASELRRLLEDVKNEDIVLAIPVLMAVVYSLRRSEVCGLRWNVIDFEDKKFLINRIVTEIYAPYGTGKKEKIVVKDYPKSRRYKTYPLIKYVEEVLLNLRKQQLQQGIYENDGYLLLNKKGELIRPNYITRQFHDFLIQKGYSSIRFHDLRHSCASVLIGDKERKVSLKDVQLWLGHTNIQSTMRYAHIADLTAKMHTAERIENILNIEKKENDF